MRGLEDLVVIVLEPEAAVALDERAAASQHPVVYLAVVEDRYSILTLSREAFISTTLL